jgi:hypothetical protein
MLEYLVGLGYVCYNCVKEHVASMKYYEANGSVIKSYLYSISHLEMTLCKVEQFAIAVMLSACSY